MRGRAYHVFHSLEGHERVAKVASDGALDRNKMNCKQAVTMKMGQLAVSIIIPMRNEERYIGSCLESILANDFPEENREILVVDGDSTDGSRRIVEEICSKHASVRLLDNPDKIVPTGLNQAIRQARGRYIIRMDAHTEYPSDYVRNCVSELERTGAANVGGRCITLPGGDTLIAKTIALLTQTPAAVGNAAYRLGHGDRYVDTVPFGAFRREVLLEVGLFREDLPRNQDYELNARIRSHGHKIFLSSKIYSYYHNVPTFRDFMRQAFLNGSWNAYCWRMYPASFCWRHAVPALFVAGLIGSLLLTLLFRPAAWLLASELFCYMLLASSAAVAIMRKREWNCALLAPWIMLSCHLVYGGASLVALFHLPSKSRKKPAPKLSQQSGVPDSI